MIPRSKSNPSGAENFGIGIKPKKKPAPPRPPQPIFKSSQSFRSENELTSYQKSATFSNQINRPTQKSDLIDFSTPPPSPKGVLTNINSTIITKDEFMYRVGASIFYIKSPLKNSTLGNSTAQPFSPPRPSVESMLSTPVKSSTNSKPNYANYQSTSVNANHSLTTTATTTNSGPTIIRQQYGNVSSSTDNSSIAGIVSNNNNNWNANSQSSQPEAQPSRYSNIPLTWDSPPKKTHPVIAPKPTIIRPKPITTTTTMMTKTTAIKTNDTITQPTKRNYYDEPPVESEPENDSNDWDDDPNDTIDAPPMPMEPPPPPPLDIADEIAWSEEVTSTDAYYNNERLQETYGGVEGDQPYAIALYDYAPEAEGDLQLQAGDLVYLTKVIDESWLYGMCGGLEGMFPTNYVNVVVALPEQSEDVVDSALPATFHAEDISVGSVNASGQVGKYHYANVLYEFKAETENDLTLEVGDVVTIWGRLNDDWLYGTLNRERGQFPSNFVSPVPDNLPVINI